MTKCIIHWLNTIAHPWNVSLADTFEMVTENDNGGVKFVLSHHYESNVKNAGDVSNAARARRLAQEAVTLSTSLPLSYNSSVFVRCDEERLDVMKVRLHVQLCNGSSQISRLLIN